ELDPLEELGLKRDQPFGQVVALRLEHLDLPVLLAEHPDELPGVDRFGRGRSRDGGRLRSERRRCCQWSPPRGLTMGDSRFARVKGPLESAAAYWRALRARSAILAAGWDRRDRSVRSGRSRDRGWPRGRR